MDEGEALTRFAQAKVATLATTAEGRPHQVPITFVLLNRTVVTAVDHKPKITQRLQRLINVEASGFASVLVHHYSDDWAELWWVRVDGPAAVHDSLDALPAASEALAVKYPQYAEKAPAGPAIEIKANTIRWWTGEERLGVAEQLPRNAKRSRRLKADD